ncbi:MAG: CAP domain-containing protein [Patescibacteria group bacterium]|jgi:uncharacterized protein YkwD
MKKSHQKFKYILPTIVLTLAVFPQFVFASDITSQNVLLLVNKERIDRGLIPLRENQNLANAAAAKSTDMINRNYFDHYAFGLTPWDFILSYDYNYLSAGENLAMDFETSEGVVNAWMKSSSHRANILNPDFQDLGVGVVKGAYITETGSHETKMVTQMFGRHKSVIVQAFDDIVSAFQNIF